MSLLKIKIKQFSAAVSSRLSFLSKKKKSTKSAINVDHELVYSLAPHKIPSPRQLKYLPKFLNWQENLALKILAGVILLNVVFLLVYFYNSNLRIIPAVGGAYSEGLVGAPQYINPLYSYNRDIDSDLSSLIFSGLFKRGVDGSLQNDLTDNWSVSDNGKTYTFKIKPDVHFQNGARLSSDDIIFTFSAIKDPVYNSPLRAVFSGVDIEKVDDLSVRFNLSEAYAGFPELLTFGILPSSLWQAVDPGSASLAELNLKPIGSGPYFFKSLTKNKDGDIKEYTLGVNNNYYGSKPYISSLTFKFYPNFEEALGALNNNNIDGLAYVPSSMANKVLAKNSLAFNNLNFPQIDAIFFNGANNYSLNDRYVRQALALALDKTNIIKDVFGGEAEVIDGPLPPFNSFYKSDLKKYDFNIEAAKASLVKSGWQVIDYKDVSDGNFKTSLENFASSSHAELSGNFAYQLPKKKGQGTQFLAIDLTIIDTPENNQLAEAIVKAWDAIGVKTNIKSVSAAQIQNTVLKGRNFEALIFGELIGNDPDINAFWHSGATANLADYKNKTVDALLETGRLTIDQSKRSNAYYQAQDLITADLPAIFLYSPKYLYLQSKKINGLGTKTIIEPSDRFANISNWFVKTKNKFLEKNNK